MRWRADGADRGADRGNAVVEVLVVGVVVCIAAAQLVLGATRLEAARAEAAAAAAHAAEWSARYGNPTDASRIVHELLPESSVVVAADGASITVEVRTAVEVVGTLGPRLEVGATRTAARPPLRSDR